MSELIKIVGKAKKVGKSVGLITGGFDILHIGHIQLFDFAKKHVDVLVVGIDADNSLKLSKGKNRPVFSQSERARFLSELTTIDYILKIRPSVKFDTEEAHSFYDGLTEKIGPTVVITTPLADKYWKTKKKRAKELGIKFLPYRLKRKSSSSIIIQTLQEEL